MVSPDPQFFDRVRDAIVGAHIRDLDLNRSKDDGVFHMTDAAGLKGILTTKVLWASLATSLNDASEVRYGIDLAKDALTSRLRNHPTEYEAQLLAALADPDSSRPRIEQTPFVISFCGRPTKSAQWLHYGRLGRGFALGFGPEIK